MAKSMEKKGKVDELTNELEKLQLSDDLYPNFKAEQPIEVSEYDSLLIKKLQLIDQYIVLTETLNSKFKEGFINISRANYSKTDSLVKFGRDYWDDRVKAIKRVQIVEGEQVKVVEFDNTDDSSKLIDGLNTSKQQSIRHRKQKKETLDELSDTSLEKQNFVMKKKYNPINMFGVIVPYQLRAAQSEFSNSLTVITSLINLRSDIQKVNRQIDIYEANELKLAQNKEAENNNEKIT